MEAILNINGISKRYGKGKKPIYFWCNKKRIDVNEKWRCVYIDTIELTSSDIVQKEVRIDSLFTCQSVD